MIIFLFWIVFSILVAVYADKKGRSAAGFFFLSLILSPLIGLIIVALVEPKEQKVTERSGMKKCPDCAEYVQGEARICRFCGHKFADIGKENEVGEKSGGTTHASNANGSGSDDPSPNQKKTANLPRGPILGAVASVVIVVCFVILSRSAGCGSDEQVIQQQAPPVKTFNTGNAGNDRLLGLSQNDQASVLGAVVGEECVGNRAFYMGIVTKQSPLARALSIDHSAFWSVGCVNGKSYEVEIKADATGSTRVLECSALEALAKGRCFVRFKDQ